LTSLAERTPSGWGILNTSSQPDILLIQSDALAPALTPVGKYRVWTVAEPNQYPDDTYETLNDYL